MRIILKIAKNELRHLFYTPIAWLLGIAMLVVSGALYTNMLYYGAKLQAMINQYQPLQKYAQTDSLTAQTFIGFFSVMLNQLYFFVPLLTMGVFNKEFNNGTIKLLYSSPVKLRQIVFGKYLAMLLYSLMLISICGIFVLLGFADINALDWPPLLAALLGMFLYFSALTAIGFFMSSLTSYQIVAAIASFTILFVLSRIGTLWQQYDFIRDITWFLSIGGRTEKMLQGLITSKDIIYYLVIIFMFVSFTYLKLKDGLETKRWYTRTAMYFGVVLIGVTVGYMGSRPVATLYWDTTRQQIRTAHPKTQEIIQQLNDGPMEITLYTNLFHQGINFGQPRERNKHYLTGFWERYQRFKPDIHYKYVYYYSSPNDYDLLKDHQKSFPGKSVQEIAGIIAKRMMMDSALFKPISEIDDSSLLASEHYRMLMKLSYRGRTTVLRTSFREHTWPSDQNVNAALNRLLDAPIPKVLFVAGQLERSIYKKGEREFHTLTRDTYYSKALINNGFDVDTVNLNLQDIPATTTLLVLADPKMELPETILNKLRGYIQSGGDMMILGEPGKQYITNPLLREIGVQLNEGQLVEPNPNETPDKVVHYLTQHGLDLADETPFLKLKSLWEHGVHQDSSLLSLAGVTSLSVAAGNGFEVKPLLMTRPRKSWLKAGKLVADSIAPIFSPEEGDSMEVASTAAIQLTRKLHQKEQRVIVTGDADFHNNRRGFPELVRAIYSWFTHNKFPVYTPYPYAKDAEYTVSSNRAKIQRTVFTWILPGLVLITAIIILIRRKRK